VASGCRLNANSVGAWISTTIGQEVLARDVGGLQAANERTQCTKFLGCTVSASWHLGLVLGANFSNRLTRFLRCGFHCAANTIGVKLTGQDVVDGDTL
jgi:hypothetical protein